MEPVSAGWRQIVLRRMFISQSNLQGKVRTLNNLFAYVCHAPLRFQIVRRDASENAETLLKSKKRLLERHESLSYELLFSNSSKKVRGIRRKGK